MVKISRFARVSTRRNTRFRMFAKMNCFVQISALVETRHCRDSPGMCFLWPWRSGRLLWVISGPSQGLLSKKRVKMPIIAIKKDLKSCLCLSFHPFWSLGRSTVSGFGSVVQSVSFPRHAKVCEFHPKILLGFLWLVIWSGKSGLDLSSFFDFLGIFVVIRGSNTA